MRTRVGTAIGLAVLMLGVGASAALAVPPNASYPLSAKYHVPLDTTYFQRDTSDAGTQAGEPLDCDGRTMTNTVWFEVTGAGAPVHISTEDDFTTYDTLVAVYAAKSDGTPGSMVTCNDDGSSLASDLTVAMTAGKDYLVQIGGCDACPDGNGGFTADSGDLTITFLGNDARSAPEPLTAGRTVTRTNWFATLDSTEPRSCRGVGYDSTVWFRFSSPAKGTATFITSGEDTAVTVFKQGSTAPLACSTESTPGTLGARTTVDVGAGDYLLQVGGVNGAESTTINVSVEYARDNDVDDDGYPAGPRDCDDSNPARHADAYDIPFNGIDENCDGRDSHDGDGDHFDARSVGGPDCDDGNPLINPDANEIRGDTIDQNCNGRAEPGELPRVNIDLKANRFSSSKLIFGKVRVSPVKRGYRVSVKCRPARKKGCPKRGLAKTIRKGRSFQSRYTYAKVLSNGAAFEVSVTRPGWNYVGVVKRFAVKNGHLRQRSCALVPRTPAGRSFRRSCR